MSPVATSDAAFRGGACPTPEYTVTYTGNYTTSADASDLKIKFHAVDPHTSLTRQKGFKVDDFYAARSRTIPPLPWSNIAPPFSVRPVCAVVRKTAGPDGIRELGPTLLCRL